MHPQYQNGFTLIETVIAIVIIGIALAGVLTVMNNTVRHSADPLVNEQAIAIAEAYMEEILLKPFTDPDASDTEINRVDFDDVNDYHGLTETGAHDQFGNAIDGLEAYSINVTVINDTLGGVLPANVLRIDVRVVYPNNLADITLRSYRTNYW